MDRAAVAAVALLDEDVRRALYEFVHRAEEPVTRDEAAAAIGISRNLAAFHLDKLVELGLLDSAITPRSRPTVGRAPRRYRLADNDVCVRIPERRPELLAEILVAAVVDDATDARSAADRVAADRGRDLGAAERGRSGRPGAERAMLLAAQVLERHGFEPQRVDDTVRLRNCPFHPLAAEEPAFVCGLNLSFVGGVVEGLGAADRVTAVLDPRAGECCVHLRRGASGGSAAR
jgi:predicted ArsR family transcriptional regulator